MPKTPALKSLHTGQELPSARLGNRSATGNLYVYCRQSLHNCRNDAQQCPEYPSHPALSLVRRSPLFDIPQITFSLAAAWLNSVIVFRLRLPATRLRTSLRAEHGERRKQGARTANKTYLLQAQTSPVALVRHAGPRAGTPATG